MNHRRLKLYLLTLLLLLGCVVFARRGPAQKTNAAWKPEITKTWMDDDNRRFRNTTRRSR